MRNWVLQSLTTDADVVPIPTFPVEKIAAVVAFENVVVPVMALAPVPDCVYPPDVVTPVTAAIAPVVSTWNCDVAPIANALAAFVVPIPTFPLNTDNAERGDIVPTPTLPEDAMIK